MLIHPSHRPEAVRYLGACAVLLVMMLALLAVLPAGVRWPLPGYVYIHAALETVSIAIGCMIAGLGFSLPRQRAAGVICLVASLFLGVAIFDFSHVMSSPGMPGLLEPGNTEAGINFWFAARTLALAAILSAAFISETARPCIHWKPLAASTLGIVLLVSVALHAWPSIMPSTFHPETGLTRFKIGYEYVLMGGYLLAAALFARRLSQPRQASIGGFCAAALVMAMSELFFTRYGNVNDGFHFAGHVYKVIAYLFLYRAVFIETVQAPYQALQQSQERLEGALAELSRTFDEREQLDSRVRMLSLVVEQSPTPMLITNHAGTIEYVNPAFETTSGYSRHEIIGQNPRFMQSGRTPPTTYTNMWSLLGRGEVWQGEVVNRRKNGQEYTERLLIYPIKDEAGSVTHFLSHKEDITEQKAAAARIRELSHFDQLTGLPNDVSLRASLRHAIDLAQHHNDTLTLMALNLDNLRYINESLGRDAGDELLRQTSRRLLQCVTDKDTVGRLSGDLFLLILPGMSQGNATLKAKELLDAVQAPLLVHGTENPIITTASIGISVYPDDGANSETLMASSEAAMYSAKADGKNDYRFFAPGQQMGSLRLLELGAALRTAAERNELRLVYQPQLNLHTGRIDGAEALIRWRHPELGDVGPAEFIPVAEQYGMITELGDWILRTALRQTATWQAQGIDNIVVAINLSASQFNHPRLAEHIMQVVRETGARPDLLELELTEAVAMQQPEQARHIMDSLTSEGLRLSIDDFGTGYSSLSYLKRFSVGKLKIDRSFVADLSTSADGRAIVHAIVQMAHGLGLSTIAEGVETEEQLALLREKGCDAIQGYHFSRPLEAGDFEQFVGRHNG